MKPRDQMRNAKHAICFVEPASIYMWITSSRCKVKT